MVAPVFEQAAGGDGGQQRQQTRIGGSLVLPSVSSLGCSLGLLPGLDDQSGNGGDHRHLGLTVLNGELSGNAEAPPVPGERPFLLPLLLNPPSLCLRKPLPFP